MTAIVVAYEDAYFEQFHLLVKALRKDRGLRGVILEGRTVAGTGNFATEVPRLLRTPLKQTKAPPACVLCVADADRPQNLVPGEALPPTGADTAALDAWVLAFEEKWRARLLAAAALEEAQKGRLQVLCVRWSKESLLTASPAALLAQAGASAARVAAVLDACDPTPTTLADGDFIVRYRKPDSCLDEVFRAAVNRKYKKGRDDETLLREHILPSSTLRAEVLRRCPDLERLLALLG